MNIGVLRTTFFLISIWMIGLPVSAQDELQKIMDKYSEVVQERDGLKKQIRDKDTQIKDTVKVLNDTINAKNKLLNDLQKELKKSSKEALEELKKQVISLTAERNKLQTENGELRRLKHNSDSIIAVRDEELEELLPFRELQLKQILEKAKEWTSLPLSGLDQQAIEKTLANCLRYGGNNVEFKNAASGLKSLQTDLNNYSKAQALLNQPFNEAQKNLVRQQLKILIIKYKDKPQLQELTETDALLRDYDGSVLIFQNLIEKINSELEDGGRNTNNKTLATETLKQVLEELKENILEIEKIPYLKKRLNEYLTALNKNPLQHWDGETEIKGMVK